MPRTGMDSERMHGPQGTFASTHWSVVMAAGNGESSQSREALEKLCRAYWSPLYSYLRRAGHSPEDAEDRVQSFFAHLLEGNRLMQAKPAKGRFRSFLLASLRHFLIDESRKLQALKRGGRVKFVPIDLQETEKALLCEPADSGPDPERAFERRWALTLLERVLTRLKEEYAAAGKADRFEQLESHLLADANPATYAELGRQLGLSEGAVKMAILRLRQRGREIFREEVAQTVCAEQELEDEVKHLFAVLGT